MEFIDVTILPYWQELKRDAAVNNINNPSTDEHNKLARFLADTFNQVVSSGRQDRTQEHNAILGETDLIKNDTKIIIQILQNGTR